MSDKLRVTPQVFDATEKTTSLLRQILTVDPFYSPSLPSSIADSARADSASETAPARAATPFAFVPSDSASPVLAESQVGEDANSAIDRSPFVDSSAPSRAGHALGENGDDGSKVGEAKVRASLEEPKSVSLPVSLTAGKISDEQNAPADDLVVPDRNLFERQLLGQMPLRAGTEVGSVARQDSLERAEIADISDDAASGKSVSGEPVSESQAGAQDTSARDTGVHDTGVHDTGIRDTHEAFALPDLKTTTVREDHFDLLDVRGSVFTYDRDDKISNKATDRNGNGWSGSNDSTGKFLLSTREDLLQEPKELRFDYESVGSDNFDYSGFDRSPDKSQDRPQDRPVGAGVIGSRLYGEAKVEKHEDEGSRFGAFNVVIISVAILGVLAAGVIGKGIFAYTQGDSELLRIFKNSDDGVVISAVGEDPAQDVEIEVTESSLIGSQLRQSDDVPITEDFLRNQKITRQLEESLRAVAPIAGGADNLINDGIARLTPRDDLNADLATEQQIAALIADGEEGTVLSASLLGGAIVEEGLRETRERLGLLAEGESEQSGDVRTDQISDQTSDQFGDSASFATISDNAALVKIDQSNIEISSGEGASDSSLDTTVNTQIGETLESLLSDVTPFDQSEAEELLLSDLAIGFDESIDDGDVVPEIVQVNIGESGLDDSTLQALLGEQRSDQTVTDTNLTNVSPVEIPTVTFINESELSQLNSQLNLRFSDQDDVSGSDRVRERLSDGPVITTVLQNADTPVDEMDIVSNTITPSLVKFERQYFVQLVSGLDFDQTVKIGSGLINRFGAVMDNPEFYIKFAKISGRDRYQLIGGGYDFRLAAQACSSIKDSGGDCFVTRAEAAAIVHRY